MISVILKKHGVVMNGHGGGEYGKDIVCAAVSSLVYAFISALCEEEGKSVKDLDVNLESGKASVFYSPIKERECKAFQIMLEKGLKLIEGKYPDRVEVKKA